MKHLHFLQIISTTIPADVTATEKTYIHYWSNTCHKTAKWHQKNKQTKKLIHNYSEKQIQNCSKMDWKINCNKLALYENTVVTRYMSFTFNMPLYESSRVWHSPRTFLIKFKASSRHFIASLISNNYISISFKVSERLFLKVKLLKHKHLGLTLQAERNHYFQQFNWFLQ